MKFVPEVGAGTRILKVKLPGYEKILGGEGEALARGGAKPRPREGRRPSQPSCLMNMST